MDTIPNSKEAITALIEELFRQVQQSKSLLEATKACGGIEALTGIGLAMGVITEAEADVYILRGEGIASLIQDRIITFEPLTYIPQTTDDMPVDELLKIVLESII